MSAHTPGPWTMDEYGNIIARGRTLRLSGVSMPCGARPYDHEEVEANAQLIAAAPDLLEALREFATQHKCGCGHPACNNCERDKIAAKAIAKAEERT